MQLTLARPLDWRRLPWLHVGLAVYAGVNLWLVFVFDQRDVWVPIDWELWDALPGALASGTLYDTDTHLAYPYSPVAAPLLVVLTSLGIAGSIALHLSALALLRAPLLIAIGLLTWGFWTDAIGGNVMVYAAVAGALALRGSRWAAIAYFALFVLFPRPVLVPLVVWLAMKDRRLALPFVAVFTVHALGVLLSGYGSAWIETALAHSATPPTNFGPTAFFGMAWMFVGVPLAAWLWWRGRVGWAGLAISPYVLPNYVLVLLWELVRPPSGSASAGTGRPADRPHRTGPGDAHVSTLPRIE